MKQPVDRLSSALAGLVWQTLETARPNGSIAIEVATRTPNGWGAPERVEVPGVLMQGLWLGGGTLLGRDSLNRRLLAVDIDRTEAVPRELARDLTDESMHNVAMHAGRLYFTLQDPQSNIWVAPVTGLSK